MSFESRARSGIFHGLGETIKLRMPRFGKVSWPVVAWLVIVAIYLTSVSACGLWDPWETHYGEVARNILVRGDPLDLWWRGGYGPSGRAENVFYSKHALPFWCMAVSLRTFGVGTSADPAEMAGGLWPELALRTPSMVFGLGAALFLSYVISRCVSRRAGLLAGIALATMPQYAVASRQAITDIYFVAPVVMAMGAWAMAMLDGERTLRRGQRFGRTHCAQDPAWRGFALVFTLAAIVPLTVLHLHVNSADTVARVSRFAKGPFLPSTETLVEISNTLWLYWGLVVVVVVASLRWRTHRDVWMGVVYIGGGLSLMGKGFLGPGLIGLLILTDMLVSGRIRQLHRVGLPVGVVIFVLTCLPWHHSMWLYRGERWFHELIIQNNLSRFVIGEQDQAVGDVGFYLRTLGIAAFPWSAILPLAVLRAIRLLRSEDGPVRGDGGPARDDAASDVVAREVDCIRLLCVWAVVTLGVLSYSVTKYYHYLIPLLPPVAGLVGVWLDRCWSEGDTTAPGDGEGDPRRVVRVVLAAGCAGLAGLVLAASIAEPAWIAHLTTYLYTGMWREGAPTPTRLAWCAVPLAVGLIAYGVGRLRLTAKATLLSAYLATCYVVDDYLPAASESWSQRTAFQTYFGRRAPTDRILSWWFYYRGETLFSKSRIWVSMNPKRKKLHEFIEKRRADTEALWFITIDSHARRLPSYLPSDLRDRVEVAYENHHYVLLRVPLDDK